MKGKLSIEAYKKYVKPVYGGASIVIEYDVTHADKY
jgi:hypothetical protein